MSLLSVHAVHALQPFLESNDIYIYNIKLIKLKWIDKIEGMSLIRENRFNTVRFVASLYVYFIELENSRHKFPYVVGISLQLV